MTIKIKHARQQWPVGHGFFHSSNIDINNKKYSYIYDCGAKKLINIKNMIDKYREMYFLCDNKKDKPIIDMIVISHFHNDHISGIPYLFDKFKVENLVMPYLNDKNKIILLCNLAISISDKNSWDRSSGLISDIDQWVLEKNQQTNVIQMNNTEEPGQELTNPNDGPNDGLLLPRNKISSHNTKGKIYSNKFELWNFQFYVKPLQDLKKTIFENILKNLNIDNEDISSKLKDSKWIKENYENFKKSYLSIGPNKQNRITLCMFSGPNIIDDNEKFDYINFSEVIMDRCCRRFCYYHHHLGIYSYNIGWLGTGDLMLKSKKDFDSFESHFNENLCLVYSLAVPHHGSKLNYNPELGDIGYRHIITSDASPDPKDHHPSSSVTIDLKKKKRDLKFVTSDPSTILFEEFEGEMRSI